MAEKKSEDKKIIANNKKAYHDYFVDETMEAGIQLFGTEVKSLRQGGVNLKDSYCTIEDGELFATGMHISPYEKGNIYNRDPLRDKKLLMHKREILKLEIQQAQKGMALPLQRLYWKNGKVKAEIGVGRGKTHRDQRYDMKARVEMMEARREVTRFNKGGGW